MTDTVILTKNTYPGSYELRFELRGKFSFTVERPTIESPPQYQEFIMAMKNNKLSELRFGDISFYSGNNIVRISIDTRTNSKAFIFIKTYQILKAMSQAWVFRLGFEGMMCKKSLSDK